MKYQKLNKDWNAEPNAPDAKLIIDDDTVTLDFYLNPFLFENVKDDQRGKLTFHGVHKYSFSNMNDEGYHYGQHRFKDSDLPWGEFYQIETDWRTDFEKNAIVLKPESNNLKHFIFFLKDNTFECVCENWQFAK